MFGRISLVSFIVIISYLWFQVSNSSNYVYPEIGYSIDQLVKSNGYPFEYHNVTTADGYVLELHRIPHGPPGKSSLKEGNVRPIILLMHGLIGSSINFLTSGDKSLPYYLVNQGYDVWLGNARGNAYSRKHKTINPDKNPGEFFDFSWHEIGAIDVPTTIDYILQRTNQNKLFYLGHSQGCISFYVMMSEKPEYNKKINLMVALAPVVHTKEIKSYAFNVPAKLQGFLEWAHEAIGYYEFMARSDYWTQFGNVLCRDGSWLQRFCHIPLGLSGGFNVANLNKTLLPLMYAHMPAGSSVKQLLHYTQVLNSDIFRQYDHGEVKNIDKYGQTTPPLYKLASTKAPVAIFHADNDWLTSERDINVLHKALPNVVHKYRVPDEHFTHFDFLISINAIDILYPEVVKTLKHQTRKTNKNNF